VLFPKCVDGGVLVAEGGMDGREAEKCLSALRERFTTQ
jgi:hypothetical protein